jgi:hypothetical protein
MANSQLHCLTGPLSQCFTVLLTHSSTASPASYCNASLTCAQLPNLTAQLPQLPQQPSVAILYCPATHSSAASPAPCHNASLSRYLTAPLPHRFPVAILNCPTNSQLHCLTGPLSQCFTVLLPHSSTASPASGHNTLLYP